MSIDTVTALRSTRLFRSVGDRELKQIANAMHERSFRPGDTAAVEGTGGVGFFVVVEGQAEVTVGGDARRTLGPGDTFGEIALIDSAPRTATVTATGDLRCLALSAMTFRAHVKNNPAIAWALLEGLARHVRDAQA